MLDSVQEIEALKEKLRLAEEEIDEFKVVLHIVTVHCCHLIAEKEGRKVEDIYKEINKNVNELMHGYKC